MDPFEPVVLVVGGREAVHDAEVQVADTRGVPHAYRVGKRAARWLIVSRPAGFERFVAAVSTLDQVDPATLTAVAAEHQIEILGPPGMLP